jgi:hypothetical protein
MILAIQSGITWNLLPLLAALALMTGAGSFLVRLLRVPEVVGSSGNQTDSSKPKRAAWGWSYLLGMALVGILLQLPLAIDSRISHRSFFGVLAICFGMTLAECVLQWRQRMDQNSARREFRPTRWRSMLAPWTLDLPGAARILTYGSLAFFLWFAAIKPSITYDARSIFGLKARVLYDTGALDGEDFRDVDRLNFNANYPLLVPLVEATMFAAQGSQQNIGLQLLFAGFVLASVSLLVAEVRRFDSTVAAALWGVGFLLLPLTLAPTEGGGLSGSADYAFAAFTTGAVIAAGRWLTSSSARNAILTCLLLGACILTKNEGLIWVATTGGALIAAIFLCHVRIRWSALATGALIAFGAIGCAVVAEMNRQGIPQSPYFRPFDGTLRLEWLIHVWTRVPFILQFAVRELGDGSLFGFVWPFSVFALVLLRRPKAPAQIVFYRCVVVGVAAAYFLTFTLTPLHLEYQLRSALFRLAVHFLPLLMLVTAEQLSASGWSRQVQGLFSGLQSEDLAPPSEKILTIGAYTDSSQRWNKRPKLPVEEQQPARAA